MARITTDMTIAEVLTIDSGTASVFMQFGMHCIGCPAASGETLEQAAGVHGIEIDALLEALNNYLKTDSN